MTKYLEFGVSESATGLLHLEVSQGTANDLLDVVEQAQREELFLGPVTADASAGFTFTWQVFKDFLTFVEAGERFVWSSDDD